MLKSVKLQKKREPGHRINWNLTINNFNQHILIPIEGQ